MTKISGAELNSTFVSPITGTLLTVNSLIYKSIPGKLRGILG
jgi:hypothetical protein